MTVYELLREPYFQLATKFAINLCAVLTLLMLIYFKRYGDRELVISAVLFNLFIFSVLTILSSVQFGVTAGFGLFAILALFTLRSEKITKIEITYFFGSVALAVICAVQGTPLLLVFIASIAILFGTYLIDHPKVMCTVGTTRLILGKIEDYALSDHEKVKQDLSMFLGVEVIHFQIIRIDYLNNSMMINVGHKKASQKNDSLAS